MHQSTTIKQVYQLPFYTRFQEQESDCENIMLLCIKFRYQHLTKAFFFLAGLLLLRSIVKLAYRTANEDPTSKLTKTTSSFSLWNRVGEENMDFEDIVLWSSDFHISPIADIKNVMLHFGSKVIDKSLSGHCHLSNTCERDLRVINKMNGIGLGNCPNQLRKQFYQSYINDQEMNSVSAFICTHAASMCELFMPFNKSLIVIASTRYEIGRHSAKRWNEWNENLQLISKSRYNIIAANNRYDQEYIKYFTNIENVLLLPNYCGYIDARYKPTKIEVLIAPARGVHAELSRQLYEALVVFKGRADRGGGRRSLSSVSTAAAAVHTIRQRQRRQQQQTRKKNIRGTSSGPRGNDNMELGSGTTDGVASSLKSSRSTDYGEQPIATTKKLLLRHKQSSTAAEEKEYSTSINGSSTMTRTRITKQTLQFSHIRDLYPHFQYSDIASHPAMVILPYQVSFMSLFEFYRMQIPLFAPSPELLTQWHMQYAVISERSWSAVFGMPGTSSAIRKHPESKSSMKSDPNNEKSSESVLEWIRLADFYEWPHITQFNSWDHLFELLVAADLESISKKMGEYNKVVSRSTLGSWQHILEIIRMGVQANARTHAHTTATGALSEMDREVALQARSFDDALRNSYGVKLSTGCEGQETVVTSF